MNTHIYFSPKTQYENVGDALINVMLCELIQENGSLHLNLSKCPENFKSNFDPIVNSIDTFVVKDAKTQFIQILFKLIRRQNCYLFLVPGGYSGEISVKQFLKGMVQNLFLHFLTMCGLKICRVGVSYERLGRLNSIRVRYRSSFLHAHHLRDNLSAQYADDININYSKISCDLAFALSNLSKDDFSQEFDYCLSFRIDQYGGQLEDIEKGIEAFFATPCQKAEPRILISSQVRRDDYAISKFTAKIKHIIPDARITEKCFDDFNLAQKVYASCGIVISNRLHVLLLAKSAQTSILGFAHSKFNRKLIGLLSDMQLRNQPVLTDAKELTSQMQTALLDIGNISHSNRKIFEDFEEIFDG